MATCPVDFSKVDFASIPKSMKQLPVVRGFPVPWFVDWLDGKPEFRAMNPQKYVLAIRERRCWVCGEKTGTSLCFVAGPMCGINRTSSEPPSHPDCGRWSAKNCPFLSNPQMVRREDDQINNQKLRDTAPGMAITRNPGVTMLWFTRSYEVFNDGRGNPLIQMGAPIAVEWWREGRLATREEVQESIDGGMPSLEAIARTQEGALEELYRRVKSFGKLLPCLLLLIAAATAFGQAKTVVEPDPICPAQHMCQKNGNGTVTVLPNSNESPIDPRKAVRMPLEVPNEASKPVFAVSGHSDTRNSLVYVKDCQSKMKFVSIYTDAALTIPLPNPFLSDSKGQYMFFVSGDCVNVNANGADLWETIRRGEASALKSIAGDDKPNTFTFSNGLMSLVTPPLPCGWVGTWDEGRQVCSIEVTFSGNQTEPITCSPVARGTDGIQHMVCWYKPEVKAAAK